MPNNWKQNYLGKFFFIFFLKNHEHTFQRLYNYFELFCPESWASYFFFRRDPEETMFKNVVTNHLLQMNDSAEMIWILDKSSSSIKLGFFIFWCSAKTLGCDVIRSLINLYHSLPNQPGSYLNWKLPAKDQQPRTT